MSITFQHFQQKSNVYWKITETLRVDTTSFHDFYISHCHGTVVTTRVWWLPWEFEEIQNSNSLITFWSNLKLSGNHDFGWFSMSLLTAKSAGNHQISGVPCVTLWYPKIIVQKSMMSRLFNAWSHTHFWMPECVFNIDAYQCGTQKIYVVNLKSKPSNAISHM